VARVHGALQDDLAEVGHEVVDRHGVLGEVEGHGLPDRLHALVPADRHVPKALQELLPDVEGRLPDLPGSLRLPVEVADRLGLHGGTLQAGVRGRGVPDDTPGR
jgi:hypothetical protein